MKSKRTKKATKEKLVSVKLPKKLVDQCRSILDVRGSSVEKFLSISLLGFARSKKPLELHDKMTFGKWAGIAVEDIARTDPEYILWLVSEGSGSKFDHEVLQLAANLTKPSHEH